MASHLPDTFQAYAPTSPVYWLIWLGGRTPIPPSYLETLANKPGIISISSDDTTIPFNQLSPWSMGIKESGILKNTIFTTVEGGTHSQGWASKIPEIFSFFDSVIDGPTRTVKDSKLINLGKNNTVEKNGTVMIKLSDLQKLFAPQFSVFEISAYATDPAKLITVQNLILGRENINIQLDKTIYRINSERYKEDAIHMGNNDAASLNSAPQFSVAPYEEDGEIYVPVFEVLGAFGCTITRINNANAATGVYRVDLN